MQTWYEYMRSLPPSKLGIFLRKKLAHNQGCPPASLMQVFTMCDKHSSCDECWWMWLNTERDEAPDEDVKQVDVYTCWHCRWGARGNNGHPFVACMNPKFYGAIMGPDDYCSENVVRYKLGKQLDKVSHATEAALKFGELTEENAEAIGREVQRRYELKQLKREAERRQIEKDTSVKEE